MICPPQTPTSTEMYLPTETFRPKSDLHLMIWPLAFIMTLCSISLVLEDGCPVLTKICVFRYTLLAITLAFTSVVLAVIVVKRLRVQKYLVHSAPA